MSFFALMIIAGVLDVLTTVYGLKLGASEANPFYGNKPKVAALLIAKILFVAFLVYAGASEENYMVIAIIWGAVVAWNLSVIAKIKKARRA